MSYSEVTLNVILEALNEIKQSLNNVIQSQNELKNEMNDVKRATSLLAVTKINKAELPYVAHCEPPDGGTVEEHHRSDACVLTRLTELYNDLNSVLEFHVMLVGGRVPYEGRIEVIYNGRHGTACGAGLSYGAPKVMRLY